MRALKVAAAALLITLLAGCTASVSVRAQTCEGTRTIFDRTFDGVAAQERGTNKIIINPDIISRRAPIVRRFIYAHECGHARNGPGELQADCFAARKGKREGWLTWEGLAEVCADWGNAPESDTHPSGPRRCANLYRCFNE